MKKLNLLILLLLPGFLIAEKLSGIKLVSSNQTTTTIEFIPSDFTLKEVSTPKGIAKTVSIHDGTSLLIKGSPDLPKLTNSIIIPNSGEMELAITSSNYYDIENVVIAPSKGNVKRNINITDVAYTYNEVYSQNEFFPSDIARLNSPYIFRDYRAQAISVCPFQYNPQTKVLRVYTKIVVTASLKTTESGINEIKSANEPIADKEFEAIYKRQFLNYSALQANTRYTPVSGNGSMLVICFDAFSGAMQPFVNWKNKKGIATEMVSKSIAGNSASAIKNYITTYYATHPNLKYVLLVGDAAQIPASSTIAGDSDTDYGYINGNDSYPELFIGRFSATTTTHVQTMVNRTINYEKTPQASGTWYKKGITIASSEGPGDNNEMDYEHERLIRTNLLNYTYNNVSENYDGSQGGVDVSGDPSPTDIASQIDDGVGIITYTGHGSDFSFASSQFSTYDISTLNNTEKHPFIWSVACVNGNFVSNSECFAEAWLREGTPASPKGALATFMSTINQSWNPPMKGQDAMVEILTESVNGNIQRTFGGLSINGCLEMNDAYQSEGFEMTDTWTTFGDPSVMVYTNTPAPMVVSHNSTEALGTISITINCDVNGALVCLSTNGIILGTGTSDGTSAVITIPAASAGIIDVTATAYNKMPYMGAINVGNVTSIEEAQNTFTFSVYPVPAMNELNISLSASNLKSDKVKIALYNNMGQQILLIADENINSTVFNKSIDVSNIASGMYFCKIETADFVENKAVVIYK